MVSDQRADNASGDDATSQWAEGLGRVFRHVAIFEVQGTVARVSAVYGVSTAVRGRSLSLSAQTPLRWSLEAASALVNSGSSPGGAIIAKGLGLLKPRAFGVLPLMVEGELVAIAYVDNGEESLSMSSVSKVFGAVDASLRDDLHYVQKLEGGIPQTDLTGLMEPEWPLSPERPHEPAPSPPVSDLDDPGELVAPEELNDLDELDELEAMLDAALAENPLGEESERPDLEVRLEEESEEEDEILDVLGALERIEPGPVEKKVVPLQEHIRLRAEPPAPTLEPSLEPPVGDISTPPLAPVSDPLRSSAPARSSAPSPVSEPLRPSAPSPVSPPAATPVSDPARSSAPVRPSAPSAVSEPAPPPVSAPLRSSAPARPAAPLRSPVPLPVPVALPTPVSDSIPAVVSSAVSEPPPPAPVRVSASAPPPVERDLAVDEGLEVSLEPESPAWSESGEVPVVPGDGVDVIFDGDDDDDDVWAESQLEEFFGSMGEPALTPGFEAAGEVFEGARLEKEAPSGVRAPPAFVEGRSRLPSPEKKSVAEKRAERQEKLNEVIGVCPEEEEDLVVEDELIETSSLGAIEEFPEDAAPPPPLIGTEPGGYPALDALKELSSSRVKPPRSRLPLMVAGLLGALLLGGVYLVAPPSVGVPGAFSFRVYANSSVNQIATHLQRQGVVRSGPVFMLLARFTGAERGLRAGQYSISREAWVWDVVEELRRGQVRTRTVTVPEGLTLQETAEIMEASGLVSTEAFLGAARDSEIIAAYNIKAPSLEGFLFPETYTFAEDLSAKDVVKEMVGLFFERIGGLVRSEESPFDLMEYVTLASIIEREAKGPREMKRIAGVFTNRLTRNMRLESCATVQYILGKPKERLMLSDLRKESPYNTYLKPGLPPGPISNPGLSALGAAFTPESHDFLFFLVKNDGSNEHVFTQTYAQHQKARLAQKQVGP